MSQIRITIPRECPSCKAEYLERDKLKFTYPDKRGLYIKNCPYCGLFIQFNFESKKWESF